MLYQPLLMGAIALILVSCGNNDDEAGCGSMNGESHVAEAEAQPLGVELVLRRVDFGCVTTGSNDFHLMPMMEGGPALTLLSVKAEMPAMGHGTAQSAEIDPLHPGFFTVNFQMPGRWEIKVSIQLGEDETNTADAVFYVDVQ